MLSSKIYRSMALGSMMILILFFIAIPVAFAYTPPSGNDVDFTGYVYYSDGTTFVSGATVYVYYPADAPSPTYTTTTGDSGYYTVGGAFTGKSSYKVYATKNGRVSPEANGTVLNTGSYQQITNDLHVPWNPPITVYGYVTRGGTPVWAGVEISCRPGGTVNVDSNSTTGYYREEIYTSGPVDVNITAHWSSNNIRSETYHIPAVTPGSVHQDITIPTSTVTTNIRVFNGGAPVPGASITFLYGPYYTGSTTNTTGTGMFLTGYYAGQSMSLTATVGGNTLSHTVTPGPDSTINYDFNFGATPTPTPPTVTPTITVTATATASATAMATPTVTAGTASSPPAPSGTASVTPSSEASSNSTVSSTATASNQPSAEPASTGIPTIYAMLGAGVIVVLLVIVAYLLGTRKK